MNLMRHFIEKRSAGRWWVIAVSFFVASTVGIVAIDFVGERLVGISWTIGPDLFPNMEFGLFMVGAHVFSASILVLSGVRMALSRPSWIGVLLGISSVAATAAVCLVAYFVFGFWYQLDIAKRGL